VAYAKDIVSHYLGRGFGLGRVRQEMGRRKVSRECWEIALEEVEIDTASIDRYIQTKLRGEIPDQREEKRVADGLFRRGFSWDEIRAGMARYLSEADGMEDEADPWSDS